MFEELVKDYGLDGRVVVMNDSGNVLVGDANLLPTKMEWNSAGYCLTKVGRDSRLVVRKQVKALTVLYLVPYQHFGVDFAPYHPVLFEAGDLCPYDGVGEHHGQDRPR